MTSASEAADSGLRRLHPLSWLFVLLAQLRQFALPLIVLLLYGRGGGWEEVAAAVGALALSLVAVWHYYTFTYRLDADALVIRSGLVQRRVRHLPFGRIHNVELRRSVLHRLFAVAELRIESATGDAKAEAQMRVLALADAERLVAIIRGERVDACASDAAGAPAAAPLARVATPDLLLLGLASNRGWVVVGAGFGLLAQASPDGWSRGMPTAFEWLRGGLSDLVDGANGLFGLALLFVLASVAVRLLGVVVELLRHYGFTLSQTGARLSVEGGLLTRTQSHTARIKIQRWQVREPWLLRRFERRALHIETAARRNDEAGHGIDALLPVAPAARIEAILRRLLPGLRWEQADWHPIHPLAWRRMIKLPLLIVAGVTGMLGIHLGLEALWLLLLAPLAVFATYRDAAFSGWSVDAERVLWRHGWLRRRWLIVERERIQGVRLRQSRFDLQAHMAHVDIDSAGARGGVTTLAFLPVDEAQRVLARLRRWLSTPLLAPEGRGEQDQHREHFESPEQHAEGAEPDRSVADRAEGGGDLAETRTEVGDGGHGRAEGRQHVEASGNEAEQEQHEADHPQGDEAADRQHHAL